MKVKIKDEKDDEMTFTLENAEISFANAIRRTAMSRVKTFAITSVVFYENTSSIFDEFIANRLGLIPLTTPEDYDDDEEITLTLEKQGPGTVLSGDIKTTDRRVGVALDNIPVIKLAEGQVLRVEAKAKVGNALDHARHQPGIISYDYDEKNEKFEFYVETFHNFKPSRMVAEAARILLEKTKELEDKI